MTEPGNWSPRRMAWKALGLFAMALGAIGAVLPILPTTPFVILAAFAFGKGSPRMARWLENNRVFGPLIADWRRSGAIAPRAKALALTIMAAVFVFSLVMSVRPVILLVQAVLMGGAALFILTRPGGRPRPDDDREPPAIR